MNNTPKLVASTTLETADWQNSTVLDGDLAKQIGRLKQQPGKNITVTGSIALVRSLLHDGLLDELALMVCPIVVGRGQRLFDDWSDQLRLNLQDAKTFGTGVLSLSYTPAPQHHHSINPEMEHPHA